MLIFTLVLLVAGLADACDPPDCDNVDEGSCVNACCKLSWRLPYIERPRDFVENVSALLHSGGPDGRFQRFDNDPVLQMWSHKGTYVVQGNHTTAKGTYVDLVQVAAEVSPEGGIMAYAFSHSQDIIMGEFAWSDLGQNYKNLQLIIKALAAQGAYDETILFGCPPPKPHAQAPATALYRATMTQAAPAPYRLEPLPSWAVAAWVRDFAVHGDSNDTSTFVHYVQARCPH